MTCFPATLAWLWFSLHRACISSADSSTSRSRRSWKKSSSCSSSSCPSTHMETLLRTPSSWTHLASSQRAQAPTAPAHPPEPPTTHSTPAPTPPWSRMKRVKTVPIVSLNITWNIEHQVIPEGSPCSSLASSHLWISVIGGFCSIHGILFEGLLPPSFLYRAMNCC